MFKNFNLSSIISIIIIGLVVGVVFVYADWTPPKYSPTRCDSGDPGCDAPINVGPIDQTKLGGITVASSSAFQKGLAVWNGLDVGGILRLSGIPSYLYFGNSGISYLRLYDPDSSPPLPPSSNTSIFRLVQNNNDKFVIDKDGDIGIGTTGPGARLHVGNSGVVGETTMIVSRNSSAPNIRLDSDYGIIDDNTTNGLFLNYWSPRNVVLANGGGNVGIGTATPVAKLDVNGGIRVATPSAYVVLGSCPIGDNSTGYYRTVPNTCRELCGDSPLECTTSYHDWSTSKNIESCNYSSNNCPGLICYASLLSLCNP